MKQKTIAVYFAVCGLTSANAVAQHVHGVLELGVVIEGNTVAVSLTAPLSDVVGFEHAPNSDEQTTLVRDAATLLANADSMFGLPESAGCEVSATAIDGPDYVKEHLAQVGGAAARHDDGHSDHEGNDDEHGGESGHEEHAEVTARYEWQCGNVSGVDTLALRFTESFASVETVNVQILTSDGAQVLTAEGRVASISLSSP